MNPCEAFAPGPVEAVKRPEGDIEKELRPVGGQRLAEAVEYFDRRAAGVLFGLEHQRRNGGDQHGLGDAALRLAVLCDIARHFAAARRMADMDGILQVEMLGDCRGIGRVVVHVVTGTHLRGATVTAPVMRDDAIAVGDGKTASACPNRPTKAASRGETRWAARPSGPSPCKKISTPSVVFTVCAAHIQDLGNAR